MRNPVCYLYKSMTGRHGAIVALLVGIVVTLTGPVFAQQEAIRTVLQQSEVPGGSDMQVIVSLLEMPPGSSIPLHTHHGVEIAVVLDGATAASANGEQLKFTPGMSVQFPKGLVHGGFTVTGQNTFRAITTQVVEKRKPVINPVKQESDELVLLQ